MVIFRFGAGNIKDESGPSCCITVRKLSKTTGVVSKGHRPNSKVLPLAKDETIWAPTVIKRLQHINYAKTHEFIILEN